MGVPTACLYAFARLIGSLSNRCRLIYYHIVVQPVSPEPRLPPHRAKQFQFTTLEKNSDLLKALPRPSAVIEERFAQGSICIAATDEDRFAGCVWLQLGLYNEDEVRTLFEPKSPNTAWDYDVFVDDRHRMGFLFIKLWDAASAYLRARDVTWTASRISGFNTNSLSSHQRLGAITVQRIVYIVLGRVQLTISGQKPWVHLSLSPSAVPKIQIESPTRGG